jgi:hypothetical protein
MDPDEIKRFKQAFSYRVMHYSINPLILNDPFDDKIIEKSPPAIAKAARVEMKEFLAKLMS